MMKKVNLKYYINKCKWNLIKINKQNNLPLNNFKKMYTILFKEQMFKIKIYNKKIATMFF